MNKLRTDSAWGALAPEQMEKLEEWLFDENLGYRETLERAQAEFGVKSSLNSLVGFYKRRARERKLESFAEARLGLGTVAEGKEREALETATLELLGMTAYEMALEPLEKMKLRELAGLMGLLAEHRRQQMEQKRLELDWERFRTYATIAASRNLREQMNMPKPMDWDTVKRMMREAGEAMAMPADEKRKKR